jgi:hypothetical protein
MQHILTSLVATRLSSFKNIRSVALRRRLSTGLLILFNFVMLSFKDKQFS